MKTSYSLFILIAFALLNGCSTTKPGTTQSAANFIHQQKVTQTSDETYPSKNPQKVAMYHKDQQPHTAYRIIGIAKVSKTNLFGTEREEAILNEMMKKLAASIGGDGLMNINHTNESVEANIIAYQKILI